MKQFSRVLAMSILFIPVAGGRLTAQQAPSELEGTFSESERAIELRWQKPSEDPLGYRVYREGPGDTAFQPVAMVGDDQYNDGAVRAGSLYHYFVTALFDGNVESGKSNTVDVSVPGDSVGTDSLAAPVDLVARLGEEDGRPEVDLRWSVGSSVIAPTFFSVYRAALPDSVFSVIGSSSEDEFKDFSAMIGSSYRYRVTARRDSAESRPSGEVGITVQAVDDSSGDSSHAGVEFVSMPPAVALVNQLFHYQVQAQTVPSGGMVCFELHDAPAGMTIDPSSGLVAWTPVTPGTFEVEIRARVCSSSDGGDAEQRFVLSVFSGAAARVTGVVRNDSGAGVAAIRVRLFDVSEGDFVFRTTTDDSGHYVFPTVNPSTYLVRVNDELGRYQSQWYNGVRDIQEATPVVISDSSRVELDFTVHRNGISPDSEFILSGSVKDDSSNAPLHARVTAFLLGDQHRSDDVFDDDGGGHGGSQEGGGSEGGDHAQSIVVATDDSGGFSLRLRGGTYILSAGADGYVTQFWQGHTSVLDADDIQVSADTAGFDFLLDRRHSASGAISGTIRSAVDSLPLESHVLGFQEDTLGHATGFTASTESDSAGSYALQGLPAGRYIVLAFDHHHDVIPTFYSINGSSPFIDSATAVAVGTSLVSGIDIFVGIDSVDGLNVIHGEVDEGSGAGGKTVALRRSTESVTALAGTIVLAQRNADHAVTAAAVSGTDGAYQIAGIAAGSYTLTFQKPGMTSVGTTVSVSYSNNTPSTVTANAQLQNSAGGPTTILTVAPQWNLVSLPFESSGTAVSSVFPGASSQAFAYPGSGGYQSATILENGAGYWLKFPSKQAIALQGAPRTAATVQVHEGWNLIGSLSGPVDVTGIQESSPGLITSIYYAYSSGYQAAASLLPGYGYWVKASANGSISMSTSTPSVRPQTATSLIDKLNSISITDGTHEQVLYFGTAGGTIHPESFEMPPAGPDKGESFDARFASGRLVEIYPAALSSTVDKLIRLTSDGGTVTARWSVRSGDVAYTLRDDRGTLGSSVNLQGQGSVSLSPASSSVSLILTAQPQGRPANFALAQNYPNPFNPSTTISYNLPVDARVVIRIYNLLGQEVATLLNEPESAGFKSVRFNAPSAAGALPSGIYLYRLEASGLHDPGVHFTQVRKMMLVK